MANRRHTELRAGAKAMKERRTGKSTKKPDQQSVDLNTSWEGVTHVKRNRIPKCAQITNNGGLSIRTGGQLALGNRVNRGTATASHQKVASVAKLEQRETP